MTYIPPFNRVKERLAITGTNGRGRVNMTYSDFVALIKLMLRGVTVDETWYLAQNPDVAEAVRSGAFRSARHHFVEEGYFEGRHPCEFEIDEAWYVNNNADVAMGIKSGSITSAKDHFRDHGYSEGRLPSED